MFEAQSGAGAQSGGRWADAFQVAVPAAVVELGIIVVVLLWAKAMCTNPASRSARIVAVAMAALCASVPTSFFVGLVAWPMVLLSCVLPAGLAAPALMRSRTRDRTARLRDHLI
ncbi:hypothetical protein [Streptomyces sp. NPDC086787]|uniref:hypothetical protein n=1 Tax=Streptomyces sp. NPDC086787 TaxID=3365759 RepID=UPI003820FD28